MIYFIPWDAADVYATYPFGYDSVERLTSVD